MSTAVPFMHRSNRIVQVNCKMVFLPASLRECGLNMHCLLRQWPSCNRGSHAYMIKDARTVRVSVGGRVVGSLVGQRLESC